MSTEADFALIDSYLGGRASADEVQALEGRLKADSDLREAFLRYAHVDAALKTMVRPSAQQPLAAPKAKTTIWRAQTVRWAAAAVLLLAGALALWMPRGVEVRVMVDDAGTRYSWPPVVDALQAAGVPAKRFMPNHFLLRLLTMNLRNHRKIMVVDGRKAFTGGMNIREGNMLSRNPHHPVQDLHFEITCGAISVPDAECSAQGNFFSYTGAMCGTGNLPPTGPTNPPGCKPGKEQVGNLCLPRCSVSTTRDTDLLCKCTNPNQEMVAGTGQCYDKCPSGTVRNASHQCEPTSCPAGMVKGTGADGNSA